VACIDSGHIRRGIRLALARNAECCEGAVVQAPIAIVSPANDVLSFGAGGTVPFISSNFGRESGARRCRTLRMLAAAGIGVAVLPNFGRADVTATWVGGSGNWTTAADWSTNPNYPNNGTPSGTDYDVEAGSTGTGSYAVTLSSSVQIDGLSLDNSGATVDVATGGSLTLTTLNANSGLFELTGGTLNAASSSGDLFTVGPTGSLSIASGTINGGELNSSTPVTVISGTFNNVLFDADTTVNVASGGNVTLNNNWTAATINAANATVNVGGSFSLANLNSLNVTNSTVFLTGTLNLGSSDTFDPSNYGSSLAVKGGTINGGTIASGATLNIATSSSLTMAGQWTNAGTIQGTNVSLNLGSSFVPSAIGTINLQNSGIYYSQLNITGTMTIGTGNTYTYNGANNVGMYVASGTVSGGTLNVGSGSTFALNGGTISGTTINTSSGGSFILGGGTLAGVTFDTNPTMDLLNELTVEGGLTGNGQEIDFVQSLTNYLVFSGNQQVSNITLGGRGSIDVASTSFLGSATLTIGSDTTINGGELDLNQTGQTTTGCVINNGMLTTSGDNDYLSIGVSSLTNNNSIQVSESAELSVNVNNWTNAAGASIVANNRGVLLLGGSWTNLGSISASNDSFITFEGSWTINGSVSVTGGSNAYLESAFTVANLGSLSASSDSNIYIEGTLNNSGTTLNTSTYGGAWTLEGGTINSGTINLGGGSLAVSSGLLNGVTVVGGTVNLSRGSLTITNGFSASGQTLNVVGSNLTFDGPSQSINDTTLDVVSYDSGDLLVGSGLTVGGPNSGGPVTLTLGSNSTLEGNVSVAQRSSGSTFINNGTLDATQDLAIQTTNFINNGLIEIPKNGNFYFFTGTNFTNNGEILLQDATLSVSGSLNIGHGTLAGTGTVGGNVILSSSPSTLSFQIGGTTQSTQYDYLQILGTIALAGDLQVNVSSAFEPSVTPNETFTVLYAEGVSGSFANVASGGRLETADGQGSFLVTYEAGTGASSHYLNLSDYLPTAEPWSNATGNNLWDTGVSANFSVNSSPSVFHTGDVVTFNDSNNNGYNVTLNAAVTPGSVVVNNSAGNYSFSGSGSIAGAGSLFKFGSSTLTLNTANTYTGGTNVNAGTLVAAVAGAIPNGPVNITGGTLQLAPSIGLTQISSLSIAGSGSLDISNNHVILNYGSGPDPIASIAGYLASGYAGGSWNGPGVMTSAPLVVGGLSYGLGYADSADPGNPANLSSGTIEIKYTLLGDADLSGVVDGTDFGIVAANFNKGVTGWDQGDFNYDNVVDGRDFSDLAANFNKGASGTSVGLPAYDDPAIVAFAQANGLMADLPEPAALALLPLSAWGILSRRRSNRAGVSQAKI
jgi:fibronectin-binding autotransporter adhesin